MSKRYLEKGATHRVLTAEGWRKKFAPKINFELHPPTPQAKKGKKAAGSSK